ncbi:MAG: hypothetical protein HKN61_03635, partial [Flavobacteriaceae bacterium]|nr:hypothetical protein [Flavobacteriaceae bacterium]
VVALVIAPSIAAGGDVATVEAAPAVYEMAPADAVEAEDEQAIRYEDALETEVTEETETIEVAIQEKTAVKTAVVYTEVVKTPKKS